MGLFDFFGRKANEQLKNSQVWKVTNTGYKFVAILIGVYHGVRTAIPYGPVMGAIIFLVTVAFIYMIGLIFRRAIVTEIATVLYKHFNLSQNEYD